MTTTTTTKTPAISAEINGLTLTIASADGERIHLDANQLTREIFEAATMHGLKQKLVDAAAISRNPDTGRSATTADKMAAIREVYERLLAGEWNKRREGSGGAAGGLLFSALCRLYAGSKTDAEVRAFIEAMDDKQQAAMRAHAKVAPIIEAIKAERAAKRPEVASVDVDAMLAGFEAPL